MLLFLFFFFYFRFNFDFYVSKIMLGFIAVVSIVSICLV